MYTIDFERMVSEIQAAGATRVMIQLPDGLKSDSLRIFQHIKKHSSAEVLFWAGSNFGACDLPVGLDKLGVDLLIHVGHTEWVY